MAERHEVSADNVISELAKIGFANLADFYIVDAHGRVKVDTQALTDPAKAAAISSIEIVDGADGGQQIKIKLADKRSALNDLGKHLGLFAERHEGVLSPRRGKDDERDYEPDNRTLAMAVLALLSEASHEQPEAPLLIEHEPADDQDFDFERCAGTSAQPALPTRGRRDIGASFNQIGQAHL